VASAPTAVLHDPRVLRRTIALQFLELVLDAATLFVCLVALGVQASPLAVFASFVMAYAAAHVAPTPLGLGTFEGASS
jgi:glycosyltransferase 2 family protein